MWWSSHVFCPFPAFFFILFVLFVVFRLFFFRRCGSFWGTRNIDTVTIEAILKRRLANGDISESDYLRLKEVLSK